MKTQFDTEQEAQEALETARERPLGYCPLINGICIKDCICYYAGDIHEPAPASQKKYWMVHYPGCTNVLINGEIRADISY